MSDSSSAPSVADDVLTQVVDLLAAAHASGLACDPVSDLLRRGGLSAAYTVQAKLTQAALAQGRRRSGSKIGLTSPAVQAQLGVSQPDFGTLMDDMEFGDGQVLPAARLIQPRVEAEIAFVIDRDLNMPRPGLAHVLRAVGYALPALEIIDSRIRDWNIGILDTIADNASSGLYVLGGTPRKIDAFNLRDCAMTLQRNGRTASTGTGAACMGNPLNAVVWLARTLAGLGQPLRAGDIVLSGALGPVVPIQPGDAFSASIEGLGTVEATLGER